MLALVLIVTHLSAVSAREIYVTTGDVMDCPDWSIESIVCSKFEACCPWTTLNITEDTTLYLSSPGLETGTPDLWFTGAYTLTIKPDGAEVTDIWNISATGSNDGEKVVVEGGIWIGLVLDLAQLYSIKFNHATLGNSSLVNLKAVSMLEIVDTTVETSFDTFATVSISAASNASSMLPSNHTSIIIKNSALSCYPYDYTPACESVIKLSEEDQAWLMDGPGGDFYFEVLDSQFYGFRTLSLLDFTEYPFASSSYSFNSSSFAARTKLLYENPSELIDYIGVFFLPLDDSLAERSRFICYNCSLRSFITSHAYAVPIEDNTELAQQIPLFNRRAASFDFIDANVTHLTLFAGWLGDLSEFNLLNSNFTDVWFSIETSSNFSCEGSNFIRTSGETQSSVSITAHYLAYPVHITSCSFIDDPSLGTLPYPQYQSLMLRGSASPMTLFNLSGCVIDRLGLSGEVLISGHFAVNKNMSSTLQYGPVKRYSPTSICNISGSEPVTLGGSLAIDSIVFANLKVLEYAPTSPGNDAGISFSVEPWETNPIFYSSIPASVLRQSSADAYTPIIRVIWPDNPSFTSINGTFPLLSFPAANGIPTLPDLHLDPNANYTFSFVQENSTAPPTGVTFERRAVAAPPPSPFSTPSPLPASMPTSNPLPTSTAPSLCGSAPISAANFTCNANGTWVTNSSITTPITVNSPIQIVGNLSTTTLTFNELGSTIDVKGCVPALPSSVTVNLSPSDFKSLSSSKSLSKTLVTTECTASDGQFVSIAVGMASSQSSLKNCQRLSGRLESRGTSLVGIFQLDSSRCNVWWIILVAVVGGVLLAIITLILIFSLVPSARRCIRPYLKREEKRKSSKTTAS